MKRYHFMLILMVICLLLPVAACGPKEPIIETPAKDMNLSVSDLGSGWSLDDERGLEGLPPEVGKSFKDANMRSFSLEGKGTVISQVLTGSSASLVKQAMEKADPIKSFTEGLKQNWAEATFETVEAPEIGEEPAMARIKLSVEGAVNINAWVLVFRKANVFALVSLIGSEDFATKELITEYGRKLEAKIQ